MNRKNRKQARKERRRALSKRAALDNLYAQNDPLGVDTSDFGKAVHQMLDRVKTGRAKEAVAAEIAVFENRLLSS